MGHCAFIVGTPVTKAPWLHYDYDGNEKKAEEEQDEVNAEAEEKKQTTRINAHLTSREKREIKLPCKGHAILVTLVLRDSELL